jgi:outer membrane protein assembly factor BamB
LWLLDADDGSTIWSTPGGATVRWADNDNGLLMYAWRSDGLPDRPNDRISVRALDDGRELGSTTVLSDYGGSTRLNTQCGGIATAERVVICRWVGNDRSAILTDTAGTPLGEWPITELPLIDADAGVVVLWVPGQSGGLQGIDAATGAELWRYPPAELASYEMTLDETAKGVLLGSSGSKNLAVSSRTGEWLIRESFDYLRTGAAIGNHVVEFRAGDALGFTGPGVGIATLQDDEDSVLFVRP